MKTLSFSVAKLRHFSRSLSVSVRFSQIMRDKSVSVRFCPFPWLGSHRSMPNCSAMYFTAIGGRSLVVGFTPSASCPERRYLRLPLQVSAIGFAGSCVEGVSQEERDNVTIYYIKKSWERKLTNYIYSKRISRFREFLYIPLSRCHAMVITQLSVVIIPNV